jgi:uncharacterized membrane protein YeaQ/YmgE (transglycosylase-associated protein family)
MNRVIRKESEGEMSIIGAIVIGLIVGALAKFIMPGKDPGGMIVTILLGIAGALVATFLGRAFGWYAEGESAGLIMSLIGAILLLLLYRAVVGRRTIAP